MVLTGNLNKKMVNIITEKADSDEKKTIILIVVEVTKLQHLRALIKENDPEAFLIISEANEMLGRGN